MDIICIMLYSQAKKAYQIRKSLLTACQIRMSLCAHCMPNKEVTYCKGCLCRFSFQRDSWNRTLTPCYTAVYPDTLHCQEGGGGGGKREGGRGGRGGRGGGGVSVYADESQHVLSLTLVHSCTPLVVHHSLPRHTYVAHCSGTHHTPSCRYLPTPAGSVRLYDVGAVYMVMRNVDGRSMYKQL